MNHKALIQNLPWYVNGTLGQEEHFHIDLHLRQCAHCAEEVEELKLLAQAASQCDEDTDRRAAAAVDRALAQIAREQMAVTPEPIDNHHEKTAKIIRFPRHLHRFLGMPMIATAAAIFLAVLLVPDWSGSGSGPNSRSADGGTRYFSVSGPTSTDAPVNPFRNGLRASTAAQPLELDESRSCILKLFFIRPALPVKEVRVGLTRQGDGQALQKTIVSWDHIRGEGEIVSLSLPFQAKDLESGTYVMTLDQLADGDPTPSLGEYRFNLP